MNMEEFPIWQAVILFLYFALMIGIGIWFPTKSVTTPEKKRGIAIAMVILGAVAYGIMQMIPCAAAAKPIEGIFENIILIWSATIAGVYVAGGY